jgi:uncharacterized membrane protein YdcZ (DUF606 family)
MDMDMDTGTTSSASTDASTPRLAWWVRVLGAVGVVVVLAVGTLVLGRLAPSDTAALVLTTLLFGAVLLGVGVLAWRRRELLIPLGVAFALSGIAVTVLVGIPMLRSTTVSEQVVTSASPGAVVLGSAPFVEIEHAGEGTATFVTQEDGSTVVTLTGFSTDPGPDLFVYLTTQDPAAAGGEIGEFVDLGRLKGNKGDQQYVIPAGTDLSTYGTVVVWCRAFDVAFVSATPA